LSAGLTIQPSKKVIVKKPQKGEARAQLVLESHMMMMIVIMSFTNICQLLSVTFIHMQLTDFGKSRTVK
jgi:hypothetical protein